MRADLFELHAQLEETHWWFAGRRRIMRRLVQEIAPPRQDRLVLDVGCGTGANIAALADEYRCVGIDTSDDAIRLARQRFPAVRFVRGFAPADVADDVAHASVLLIMDVLEHVRDDFALLSSLLAPLPTGANLLLTVPAEAALWSEHDVSFGHYRRYHAARLAQLWQGLPVRVRLLSYFNTRLYPVVKAVRTMARITGRASGEQATDLSLPPSPVNRALNNFFAGEADRLLAQLRGQRGQAYGRGVSLVAILERQPGKLAPRSRPAGIEPDLHDPEARSTGGDA